jgi:very-long-chain (3R)-3-hydroxyacyl-CoA dehydratase
MVFETWIFFYNLVQFGGWTWLFLELVTQVGRFLKTKCFTAGLSSGFGALFEWPALRCSGYVLLGWWTPPPLRPFFGFANRNWQVFEAQLLGSTLQLLLVFQTLTLLELVHAMLGWVRASPGTTALQICSRLFVLWLIVGRFASALAQSTNAGYLALLSAWSATEVVRYAYFAVLSYGNMASGGLLSVHELVPAWLTWLRYSMFLVHYPIGVSAEIWLVLGALPLIRETRFLRISMPNRWNFAFDFAVFSTVALLGYIPGLPFLYGHMLKQRRKHLLAAKQHAERKGTATAVVQPALPKQKAT